MIFDLRGGLGNQLFEWAAATTLRKATGAETAYAYLEPQTRWLRYLPDPAFPRCTRTEAMRTLLRGRTEGLYQGKRFRSQSLNRIIRTFLGATIHAGYREISGSGRACYAANPHFISDQSYRSVGGYFQHPIFFDRGLEHVVNCGRTVLSAVYDLAPIDSTVGVHVRGGDYASWNVQLDPAYYVAAAAVLPTTLRGRGFTIVSGDHEAAEHVRDALVSHGYRAEFTTATEVPATSSGWPPYVHRTLGDFATLSRYRHVIMSNSTFCWWAVVMGEPGCADSARSIVIPSPWFPWVATELARPRWTPLTAQFLPDDAAGKARRASR